ncbi:MAG: hypothetical protein ACYTAN_13090 [Planctomycetota bacterium]|jgi:hypothetical protein
MRHCALAVVVAALALAAGCQGVAPPAAPIEVKQAGEFEQLWVYSAPNFADDAEVDTLIEVMRQAKPLGVTHFMIKDPKFGFLGMLPPSYFANIDRTKAAAEEIGIIIIPALYPFGYGGGYLMHDANLAAGLPVKNAPFVVKDGVAKPDPAAALRIANGGFEGADLPVIPGWAADENSAVCLSLDSEEKVEGETSLRMSGFENLPQEGRWRRGRCSVTQHLRVQPFKYYRLTIQRKTSGLEASGSTVYIGASDATRQLCYTNFESDPTADWQDYVAADSDWREFQLTFNTLEARSIRISVGVGGARSGTVWWDDLKVEPAGLANVLRRPIKPLVVTSADGSVTYVEGEDFEPVADPMLGNIPTDGRVFPKFPFDVWHPGPGIVLTADSRIKEEDRLLVSYYHPHIIYGEQILVSMEDPKTYELMDDQMKRMVEAWGASGYMMNHDEIRIAGWEEPADGVKRTPGEILAYNIRRSVEIARKYAPDATLYTWSDMFDPFHNAYSFEDRNRYYYLVNGNWDGGWEGLPNDVVIFTWISRPQTLARYAELGHKQILCGYYDGDSKRNIMRWMRASEGVPNVAGMMYTTWRQNYGDLAEFFGLLKTYETWIKDEPPPSERRRRRFGP